MIHVTVKTLTGIDHSFEVEEELTIRQFKERINDTVQVPTERQRLIFQGRVLKDERILSEIGLDHRTVHLVERLPGVPGGGSASSSPLLGRRGTGGHGNGHGAGRGHHRGPAGEILQQQMVMGAVALPSGDLTSDQIAACLRRILNRVGDIGRRAELRARDSPDGTSVQVDIRIRTPLPGETADSLADGIGRRRVDGPATQRVGHIRHIINHIDHILYHLENDEVEQTTNQQQQQPSDGIDVENASHSLESCNGCHHHGETAGATSTAGAGQQSSDESDYYRELDTIDGEELEIRQTRIRGLATLLDEILRLEERLRPHLARYQEMLRQDAAYDGEHVDEGHRASRLFNSVQTILHNLAHVYHTYGDLNVHFCQPPPRYLYPQLVGMRTPPTGQLPAVQRAMSTVHTTAEVQITMNFQRGNGQEEDEQSEQASPQQQQPNPAPSEVHPFPNIHVEGANGMGIYTSVDIGPNAVTINQVAAQMGAPDQRSTQPTVAATTPIPSATAERPEPQHQPQQQQPPNVPPNFFQQLMQGIAGATAGMVAGNLGMGPDFAAHMQRAVGAHRPQMSGQIPAAAMRPRMPRPGRGGPHIGRHPTPRMFRGQPPVRAAMVRPQSLIFSAEPYNPQTANIQPAVFVGYDPPALMPLYTFDEYLPCGSRHFDPRQRPSIFRHGQPASGASGNQASNNDLQQDPTQAAAQENASQLSERELEFERHLEPVVRSVVSSLQESVMRPRGPAGGQGDDGIFQFVPVVSGMPGPSMPMGIPAMPTGGTIRLRPGRREMGQMRRPSSDPNLARAAEQQPATGGAAADDRATIERMITDVFTGMMGNSRQTIGEYLRSQGHENEHSDSILVEVFQSVMLSLSFSDIWSIFANDPGPLERSRPMLRRHFVEHLLNGNESPSEEDIQSAATRSAENDGRLWREITAEMETAEDLDLASTMVRCEEAFLMDLMLLVFGYSFQAGEEFGRRLYDRSWLYAREAVTLALICCADGERGFEQFANRVAQSTMRNVSAEFGQMMAASGVQHLRTLYTNHRLDRRAVDRYLVKKQLAMPRATTPSVSQSTVDGTTAGSSSALNQDHEGEFSTPSSQTGTSTRTEALSEDWTRYLPPDQVSIVEEDIERQRSMPQQKPFSDAYLNGMPSKRRKVIYDQRMQKMLNSAHSSTDAFLKETLNQAISAAGATPITGEQVEDVIDHVSVDENGPELAEEFARNVEQRIGARLRSEQKTKDDDYDEEQAKDFDPEHFPNASAKFLKK